MTPTGSRFLSREACLDLLHRATSFAVGGGTTGLSIESTWTGNLRWGRNAPSSSGDVRNNDIWLSRTIRGAHVTVVLNLIDDASIHAAVRRAERLLLLNDETYPALPSALPDEPYAQPAIWSDATYGLDADRRADVMRSLVQPAIRAGMLAAGYIQVAAHGRTVLDSDGRSMYYPYTTAQYSVTVRDPTGTGSGWAGVDWADWTKIDGAQLSSVALDKCLSSRNPVAIEPGHYTAILEPQAVCDFLSYAFIPEIMDRQGNEDDTTHSFPYSQGNGLSKIGLKLLDERVTVTADPVDPMLGFPPFDRQGNVYHAALWFENGVLKNLAYDWEYAVRQLGKDQELPTSGAYHIAGGTTSKDEMIATTRRGVLVTRFSQVKVVDFSTLLETGFTRDGLWLIENGKISKAIKNFRFTESPLIALDNLDQVGIPQRVFHPEAPVVVPPLKVRDFSFTSLIDAV